MDNPEYVLAVLDIAYRYDIGDQITWHVKGSKVEFAANCSDVFYWGSADAETIHPDDVAAFEKACADAKAADPVAGTVWAPELFAARKRGMRPQGACYKHYPQAVADLFDACGPARATGLGNPRDREQYRIAAEPAV